MIDIDVQRVCDLENIPNNEEFILWVETALQHALYRKPNPELTIRIVDEQEIRDLNKQYRDKDKSTNVLSFASDLPEGIPINLLGDLIVCPSIVEHEAQAQQKTLTAHWCHMTVHGALHLLGFDHIDDNEAEEMESLEITILKTLGFNNPYEAEYASKAKNKDN